MTTNSESHEEKSPLNVKTVIAILGLIVIIYIIAKVTNFANSPLGKALSSSIGAIAGIITALAGLPSWLLIGIGAAFLFGPAVLKISADAAIAFGKAAPGINEDIKKLELSPVDEEASASLAVELARSNAAAAAAAAAATAENVSLAKNAAADANKALEIGSKTLTQEQIEDVKESVDNHLPLPEDISSVSRRLYTTRLLKQRTNKTSTESDKSTPWTTHHSSYASSPNT